MFGALAMLVSTVIGAGVLGLPRVFYETGLFSLPLLAVILSALYLLGIMILEMLDSEKKPIQLPALIASKIGDYRRIREVLSGREELSSEDIESYNAAEKSINEALNELASPLILKSELSKKRTDSSIM